MRTQTVISQRVHVPVRAAAQLAPHAVLMGPVHVNTLAVMYVAVSGSVEAAVSVRP